MINKNFIDYNTNQIIKKLKNLDFETFLLGIISDDNQEIKKEYKINLGKILEEKLDKKVDFKDPDILILIDLKNKKINYQIKSLYIFGRYQKLVAGIPQTKWKRKKFKTSVEEEIGKTLLKMTLGESHSFHGCGREDIDVTTIGEGRPFVIEIINPKKRNFDLKEVEKKINENSEFVKVSNLQVTNKNKIKDIKSSSPDKVYQAEVELEKEVSKDELENACHLLSQIVINQKNTNTSHQTPSRYPAKEKNLLF